MYDENSMKSHIFWIKVRRIFLLLVLTAIGTGIGVLISDYVVNILLFPAFLRIVIIVTSALLFLGLALLLTAHTGKEIEDGYWKIAVYKKLAIISKKLDNLEKIDVSVKPHQSSKKETSPATEKQIENTVKEQDNKEPEPETQKEENVLKTDDTQILNTSELKEALENNSIVGNLEIISNTEKIDD